VDAGVLAEVGAIVGASVGAGVSVEDSGVLASTQDFL
jgi:hypothetical protein